MQESRVAVATVTVDAPRERVWKALVTPSQIKTYMFGTTVESDFKPDSPITWKGEWNGKHYEDKGRILDARPGELLRYTHFSPLAGLPDKPENYHVVTIELGGEGAATRVTLSQDNNPSDQARQESEKNWTAMLNGLKRLLET
jgi:uncharacterized protein YndB with AHSA1/START domain